MSRYPELDHTNQTKSKSPCPSFSLLTKEYNDDIHAQVNLMLTQDVKRLSQIGKLGVYPPDHEIVNYSF